MSPDEEEKYVFQFKGDPIKGKRISYQKLKSLTGTIAGLAKDVNIDEKNPKDVDFDIEINEGSTELCAYPIDEYTEDAFDIISSIFRDFSADQWNSYLTIDKVKRRMRSFFKTVDGWASEFTIRKNVEKLGTIQVNESIYERLKIETERFPEVSIHVFLINRMYRDLSSVQFSIPKYKTYFVHIKQRDLDSIKKEFGNYAYVKIRTNLSRNYMNIISFSPIPNIEKINDARCFDPKMNSLLEKFRAMEEDWNGYDARPIKPLLIKNCRRYINYLESFFKETKIQPIYPEIYPMTDGRIQLEWENEKKYLEIEMADNNYIVYKKWIDERIKSKPKEMETTFSVPSFLATLDSIIWFITDYIEGGKE